MVLLSHSKIYMMFQILVTGFHKFCLIFTHPENLSIFNIYPQPLKKQEKSKHLTNTNQQIHVSLDTKPVKKHPQDQLSFLSLLYFLLVQIN